MIFSIIYYLELRNATNVFFMDISFITNKGWTSYLDIIER